MGCDGGTIPKRKEIVKNKQKDQGRDKNADLSAIWQFCALSGLRLKKPIVACQLGRLYNKDAIIEYLLEPKQSSSSSSSTVSTVSHIRSLKDVKELKLKEKSEFDGAHRATSGNEQFQAQFVCPISGLDLNGKYKFYYLLRCGCVISERALKEVPNEKLCLLCSRSYEPEHDLIVLNGDAAEVDELKRLLVERRRRHKSAKKEVQSDVTSKGAEAEGSTKAGSSSSRRKHDDDDDDGKQREHSKRPKKPLPICA